MNIRGWMIYFVAVVALASWLVTAPLAVPAGAEPPKVTVLGDPDGQTGGRYRDDAGSWAVQLGIQDMKNNVLSSSRLDTETRYQFHTTITIKPLKTENFRLAFGAGAPILSAGSHPSPVLSPTSRGRIDGAYHNPDFLENDRDLGLNWMVISGKDKDISFSSFENSDIFKGALLPYGDQNSYYMVEMLFLPSDDWAVRGILSIEQNEDTILPSWSPHLIDESRIGMSVGMDYRLLKSTMLNIGYGHYFSGRQFNPSSKETDEVNQQSDWDNFLENQVFTARLQIRF